MRLRNVDDSTNGAVLGIKICNGYTVWRFYEGENKKITLIKLFLLFSF